MRACPTLTGRIATKAEIEVFWIRGAAERVCRWTILPPLWNETVASVPVKSPVAALNGMLIPKLPYMTDHRSRGASAPLDADVVSRAAPFARHPRTAPRGREARVDRLLEQVGERPLLRLPTLTTYLTRVTSCAGT